MQKDLRLLGAEAIQKEMVIGEEKCRLFSNKLVCKRIKIEGLVGYRGLVLFFLFICICLRGREGERGKRENKQARALVSWFISQIPIIAYAGSD